MQSTWRPIPKFPNYQISNYGVIKSIRTRKIVSSHCTHNGYLRIALCKNGEVRKYAVHRLVAEVFIGKCPIGHEINHKDFDRMNNFVHNLEWVTPKQNRRYSALHGVYRGMNNGRSILTDEKVRQLKNDFLKRIPMTRLSIKYGISYKNVQHIKYGHTWKHIK